MFDTFEIELGTIANVLFGAESRRWPSVCVVDVKTRPLPIEPE